MLRHAGCVPDLHALNAYMGVWAAAGRRNRAEQVLGWCGQFGGGGQKPAALLGADGGDEDGGEEVGPSGVEGVYTGLRPNVVSYNILAEMHRKVHAPTRCTARSRRAEVAHSCPPTRSAQAAGRGARTAGRDGGGGCGAGRGNLPELGDGGRGGRALGAMGRRAWPGWGTAGCGGGGWSRAFGG